MAQSTPDVEDLDHILPRGRDELSIQSIVRVALYVLGFVTVTWHVYYGLTGVIPQTRHVIVHFGLLLTVYYLNTLEFEPDGWRDHLSNAVSIVLMIGAAVASVYLFMAFWRLLDEVRAQLVFTQLDLIMGLIVMVVATHATWRAYGHLLAGVVGFAFFYGYFGYLFPSVLFHGGLGLVEMIRMNSIALRGLFGSIMGVGATWVAIFIFFAGIVEGYGGMAYVIQVGQKAGKFVSSGVVQIAVISSMLMGSITGSSAANVATTGSFTIPLMRQEGVEGKFAGAIESVASTGGQILPPVMGSAAFLMADIIAVPYFAIILGAILPALLFYTTVAFVVHIAAVKNDWAIDATVLEEEKQRDLSMGERLGELSGSLLNTLPYTVPLIMLVWTLVVLRFDPLTAGIWTIAATLVSGLIRDVVTAPDPLTGAYHFGRRTLEGLKLGTINMAPLAAVIGALNMVVRILTQTGFTLRFSLQMINLAGGVFFLVILLAMVASILFGMGMPTPAAYIVVAILTAPALTRLGVQPITAHMFVFYFALLSTITPPVALSCAVAAGIAEAKFMDVAKETIRLGLFAFIIPWIFILNPELIYWEFPTTAVTFGAMIIGLWTLGMGLVGFDLKRTIPYWQRVIYIGLASVVFFVPQYSIQVGVAGALIAWFVLLMIRTRTPDFLPAPLQ